MRSKILKGIALACSGKVLELVEVQFRHLQTAVAKRLFAITIAIAVWFTEYFPFKGILLLILDLKLL